jgi:hypothetical protein
MAQRIRFLPGDRIDAQRIPEFINPFSYMSSDDARVWLELWHRNVPFTYRYFDGADQAPSLKQLVPDFTPEFTMSEYKTVILVHGGFWGTLPGVLDTAALARVALEHDGWKVVILFEADILHNLVEVLNREFPEKPSPFAPPHWMFTRRQFLRGLALLRTHFEPKLTTGDKNGNRKRDSYLRRTDSASNRARTVSDRYRKSGD